MGQTGFSLYSPHRRVSRGGDLGVVVRLVAPQSGHAAVHAPPGCSGTSCIWKQNLKPASISLMASFVSHSDTHFIGSRVETWRASKLWVSTEFTTCVAAPPGFARGLAAAVAVAAL
jgi:hypothetical protein